MSTRLETWIRGIISAFIGGGAAAVTSGVTSLGLAPDKFNFTSAAGVWHLLAMIGINFLVSGILSVMFFLRQSPLPPESTGNTETIIKPNP